MTNYLLFVAVASTLFAGCVSNKPRVVKMSGVPGTMLSSSQVENVRHAENIKRYPVSRYIDPNNPRIMHEGHPVYRIESTAKWNLRPNKAASVSSGPPAKLIDPATRKTFDRDELYLELQRQKQVTDTILQGSGAISSHLNQLGEGLQATRALSQGLLHLQEEVNTTRRRIDAFEEDLRLKQETTPSLPTTSAVENQN